MLFAVVPPRVHALVATTRPVAVVFVRTARSYWHLLRWDLDSGRLEPGAWFRGGLYPRRADLSPDGDILSYFAADWRRRRGDAALGAYSALKVRREEGAQGGRRQGGTGGGWLAQ